MTLVASLFARRMANSVEVCSSAHKRASSRWVPISLGSRVGKLRIGARSEEPDRRFFFRLVISLKALIRLGERAGARTQDPVIKSHVLYRLSYALPWPLMALRSIAIVFGHSRSMSCRFGSRRGENRLFPDHAFGPRCVGGWGAEVNSGRGCRRSRQGPGFVRRSRHLAGEFKLD